MDTSTIPRIHVHHESATQEDVVAAQGHLATSQNVNSGVQKQSLSNLQIQSRFQRLNPKPYLMPVRPLLSDNNTGILLPHEDGYTDVIFDLEEAGDDLSFAGLCNVVQPSVLSSGNCIDNVMSLSSIGDSTVRSYGGASLQYRRHNTFPSARKSNTSRGNFAGRPDKRKPSHPRRNTSPVRSVHQNHNLDFEALRRAKNSASLNVNQIFSTLEPVMQLPVEVTAQERNLLHFYLTFGRKYLWGTSENPKHCPALDIARYLMQNCANFVLTSIIMAETILNHMTGRGPQATYFQRRARIYHAVNCLLSDASAPMLQKTNAIMYLAALEHANGQTHLQNMHIRALDDLIGTRGGLTAHLSCLEDNNIFYISARFYTSQFIRAEVQIPTLQQLDLITQRYIQTLRRIRNWTSSLQSVCSYAGSLTECRSLLSFLIDYFSHLIEVWLSEDQESHDFQKLSGAHFCAFSLLLTLLELDQSQTTTFEFLQHLQSNMVQSTDMTHQCGSELNKLHAYTAAHIIAKTRFEVLVVRGIECEIRISQAIVDAQKVFVLLSSTERIAIVSRLVEKIFGSPRLERAPLKEDFDEQYLQSLVQELSQAWRNQRCSAGAIIPEVG